MTDESSNKRASLPDSIHELLIEVEDAFEKAVIKPLSSFIVGTIAAMSGILFGFDASIAAAAGDACNEHFGITNDPFLMGLWVGCVPLGALFGALFGGKVANSMGRRKGLLLNAVLFIGGILLASMAPTFNIFIAARLLMGVAIGNSAVITPMYMAEVAPPESRGRILFMYQLSIVVGILISFIVGVGVDTFVTSTDISWRIMIAIGLVPATIFLLGMLKMPDSPRWLIEQELHKKGHEVLLRMMGKYEARDTFADIHNAAIRKEKVSISAIFSRTIFPVILLGVCLQFFQQATGINADMYFGPEIFRQGGFDKSASMWAQVAMGVVNLVATITSIFMVDKLGRRKLMMIGVSGIVLMLCAQAYLFHRFEESKKPSSQTTSVSASHVTSDSAGQRSTLPNAATAVGHKAMSDNYRLGQAKTVADETPTKTTGSKTITYLIFFSILLYIVFFAISAGPLVWLMISEVFPIRFKGIGMSIAVASNWFMDYFVSQLFPIMKQALGMPTTTLIYAGFTTFGLALAFKFLPETKGVPLEKIEENIYAGKPLREIGQPKK
ncbi:sugar porter family MFS transporter [Rubellicoccus peritrichatus]|uniref:Sugar porter family MFS transporter n=1 Tax=Rubellicoccus peritrichatus TaxID=3080537 RepID=A0AAQ3LDK5_9BACT|nr:sugar porter family MFS transporter [Puniceicoccus sp. CR14]WOO41608.1 sugar porter family MFS transporter [Puniceicoccus sp. CR14]